MSDFPDNNSRKVLNTYKKFIKTFGRSKSELKNRVDDIIDEIVIKTFKEITKCLLCTIFIVLTARNSCCSICFLEWMNEHDVDIIKCRMCNGLIKSAMNSNVLGILCQLVYLDEKKRPGGHFGYPVVSANAMDEMYECLMEDSEHHRRFKIMADFPDNNSRKVLNTYKKFIKTFGRSKSELKNSVDDIDDEIVIKTFKETTKCLLCTIFIVLTARNSCCSICFLEWMNEHDVDIIKCRMCNGLIKSAMNSNVLGILCQLVYLDEKKRPGGHFGYPVVSANAMDEIYECLMEDSEVNTSD